MPQYFHINDNDQQEFFLAEIGRRRLAGKKTRVMFVEDEPETRTPTQNKCLHQWLGDVATYLNDAGYDMKSEVLREGTELPWTQESVKNHLWRPVMVAMTDVESTTLSTTKDYPAVYEALTRHLQSKLGVTLPVWPTRFNQ